MVTAEYAITLEEIQDMMWLNHNNQNYKYLAIYFVNIKYYKLLSEGRKTAWVYTWHLWGNTNVRRYKLSFSLYR